MPLQATVAGKHLDSEHALHAAPLGSKTQSLQLLMVQWPISTQQLAHVEDMPRPSFRHLDAQASGSGSRLHKMRHP